MAILETSHPCVEVKMLLDRKQIEQHIVLRAVAELAGD